jgi:hypothetical protein
MMPSSGRRYSKRSTPGGKDGQEVGVGIAAGGEHGCRESGRRGEGSYACAGSQRGLADSGRTGQQEHNRPRFHRLDEDRIHVGCF